MGGNPVDGTESYWTAVQASVARAFARIRSDIGFAVVDAGVVLLAYLGALAIRLVEPYGDPFWNQLIGVLPIIVAVHLLMNLVFGAYGHVWEYASVGEAVRIAGASASSALVLIVGELSYERLVSDGEVLVPVGALILGALLAMVGMGAIRFRSRLFSLKRMSAITHRLDAARTLVVGTDRTAADLARYGATDDVPFDVVGFISPNGTPPGKLLAGRPVLGKPNDVARLVEELNIDQVIIANANAAGVSRYLVDQCLATDVRLRILPHPDDVLGSKEGFELRDLELTDLLPRPAVDTNLQPVEELLRGMRVMVTGAGGSIGAEIVRQVLQFEPASVIALDHDETHLHDGLVGWEESGTELNVVLADIREKDRLERCFQVHRPDVVFHAAAHKHVPILEDFPEEAARTNVDGTANLVEMARRFGTSRFVLISTDKAVDPSSVMGASKRLAEMLVQSADTTQSECTFAAVRFGNVLGSRGSVVPTFMRQIQDGGPVTVSDRKMQRYFMTVDEAVQLVLQASALADGGEVFVLDMGEPVRIIDLAHRLIRVAGLVPGRDIEVIETGPRRGEKFIEVLSVAPLEPSKHPKISVARVTCPPPASLHDAVVLLSGLADAGDRAGVKEVLHNLARRDWPTSEVVDLTAGSEAAVQVLDSQAG